MKATNALEGLGMRIMFVVSISICVKLIFIRQSYDIYSIIANFQAVKISILYIFNTNTSVNVEKRGEVDTNSSTPPYSFNVMLE